MVAGLLVVCGGVIRNLLEGALINVGVGKLYGEVV